MTGAVHNTTPISPYIGESTIDFMRWRKVAEVMVQIAVRVFFVASSILMASSTLGNTGTAVVALSATALAGFFFPDQAKLPPLPRPPRPIELIHATPPQVFQPIPLELLPESPRGLKNDSNNCAFNSLVHYLEADPELQRWIRNPLPDTMDLPTFENFLAGYSMPQPVIAAFRAFVQGQQQPLRPLPILFKEFSAGYHPADDHRVAFVDSKEKYDKIFHLRGPLTHFFAQYDQARRNNQLVAETANTQSLREALHEVNAVIEPSAGVQIDAPDALMPILGALPDRFLIHTRQIDEFDIRGRRPLLDHPDGIITKTVLQTHLAVAIPKGESNPQLERLLRAHCDSHSVREFKSDDGVNREYPVHERLQFLEAPSALRIQLKRFYCEWLPKSWLTNLFSSLFPNLGLALGKIEEPVQVPEELSIQLENGQRVNYRLSSFVHHSGTNGGGHYRAGRLINGHKYLMNDREVTVPDQAEWDKYLSEAYLLCYLPVQA